MKRIKVHPKYYAIEGHMILKKKSYEECANYLGMSVRSYKEKIVGFSDFSAEHGRKLADLFKCSQDEIFLI